MCVPRLVLDGLVLWFLSENVRAADLPRLNLGPLPAPNGLYPPPGAGAGGRGRLPAPLLQSTMRFFGKLPTPRKMSLESLLEKMGKDFDPERMSIQTPLDPELVEVSGVGEGKLNLDTTLLPDLEDLNFTYVDENSNARIQMKPSVQKVLEKWLLEKATCPVRYTWHDLGVFYWPRWLRQGTCVDDKPCSWPPGMHCVPAESKPVRVLRWYCRPRRRRKSKRKRQQNRNRNRNRKLLEQDDSNGKQQQQQQRSSRKNKNSSKRYKIRCRWKKVRYPVTSECFCSC